MTSKTLIGVVLGACAGVLDVIPMIAQGLSWDANISAFLLWAINGFFISTSTLKINPALKGVIISFLVLAPAAVLIGWNQPMALIPIAATTLILGAALGYAIDKLKK